MDVSWSPGVVVPRLALLQILRQLSALPCYPPMARLLAAPARRAPTPSVGDVYRALCALPPQAYAAVVPWILALVPAPAPRTCERTPSRRGPRGGEIGRAHV